MFETRELSPYATIMAGANVHIEIVLDTNGPVELSDFLSAFSSLANQYQRYMRKAHPDLRDDAALFVREVRQGSIIADLVPHAASLIGLMDQVMIVDQFVRLYGERIRVYFQPGGRLEDASKSDLSDFMGQVAAIACSDNGRGQIRAVSYEDGKREIRAHIEFNQPMAERATREIEAHKRELDTLDKSDYERVLMTFKRSDVGNASIGSRSGERVVIEDIAPKDKALIYGAPLAEQRIKAVMRDPSENIFHKGFVVDVNVQGSNGRPVAYSVTHVHQIIDIGPEED